MMRPGPDSVSEVPICAGVVTVAVAGAEADPDQSRVNTLMLYVVPGASRSMLAVEARLSGPAVPSWTVAGGVLPTA